MRIDGQRTRAKLVDTAEQLFAAKGIDNVTLLAVNKAAGQSNRNAAAYYFGDKRGLLEAVLRKHSTGIHARRLERLASLGDKPDLSLVDLMGAIVGPLADKLAEGDSGIAYLRINGQLMESPEFASLRGELGIDLRDDARIDCLFRRLVPRTTPQQRAARSLMVEVLMYHGLSAFASRPPPEAATGAVLARRRAAFVAELVDALCAVAAGAHPAQQRTLAHRGHQRAKA